MTGTAARRSRATGRRRLVGGATPRSVGELLQGGEEVVGEVLEVGQYDEVADEAEVERAVVGDDRDPQVEVGAERHHREHVGQLAAVEVERELRPGHVGHDEVDEALARDQPGRLVRAASAARSR